jgi:hypothetical protein
MPSKMNGHNENINNVWQTNDKRDIQKGNLPHQLHSKGIFLLYEASFLDL